ncbi:hypothetical protein AGRHK599_LOCUS4751 [Rhizobium rhizogenes]|uniref:Uncharacterized protein n=1 Tax=Rhizobium rhizogenes TaxID=359 RepID=A0AAN2AAH5_RHIRH|nr:hypothetical protein AGRHK599_LOCUS4751 [Rhizobium rhizogenes]
MPETQCGYRPVVEPRLGTREAANAATDIAPFANNMTYQFMLIAKIVIKRNIRLRGSSGTSARTAR